VPFLSDFHTKTHFITYMCVTIDGVRIAEWIY
jgi:hypothetical protein